MRATKTDGTPVDLLCIWHCAGCNAHFRSVDAFDRHRPGGECSPEPETLTHEKTGKPRLQKATETGTCALMHTSKDMSDRYPVTVWQVPE